jgi:hypothetical protein
LSKFMADYKYTYELMNGRVILNRFVFNSIFDYYVAL